MGYFRPIIVATLCDSSLEPKDRIELYQIIERCIFTWFRMAGFNNTLYSVESYNISRILFQTFNLKNTNKSSAKYKKSIFTNKEISLMFGVSEDEIDNSFEMNENKSSVLVSLYVKFLESKFQLHYKSVKDSFIARVKNYLERDGYFDWKPLRYFLYEYEDYLYVSSKRLDQIPATWRPATKGYYSIEHIYPQKPQDWYWENQFRDYSTTEKEMCIKALGNMLLLANDINASLQNHSYKRKCKPLNKERTGYINGSFSERKVANENNDWNPLNIYRRTIELLDFFGRRWNINFDKKEKNCFIRYGFYGDKTGSLQRTI